MRPTRDYIAIESRDDITMTRATLAIHGWDSTMFTKPGPVILHEWINCDVGRLSFSA